MAKMIIAGNAIVIKSTLNLEDIKQIGLFDHKSLVMRDDEGHALFGVCVSERGHGTMDRNGVTFDRQADSNGAAVVTLPIPSDVGNKKEYAADTYGQPLSMLTKFESTLLGRAQVLKDNRAATIAAIEVAE